MCGISGFGLRRPVADAELARAGRIGEALRHRGPDGAGKWLSPDRRIGFGHRRLAIIDLREIAGQPMERNGLVCCYNGELYNYLELRRELEGRGHRFSTAGDTEVLLAAWQEWGERSLDRFDGMFAFALYEEGRIHLATDPFGEKPLFLAELPDGIHFASEAGPLIGELGLHFDPSHEVLARFLALGHLPPPETGYPGLSLLPPATHLVCEEGRVVSRRQYWRPPRPEPRRGRVRELDPGQLDRIAGILVESLRRRVRADVPLGLFLSTGTDSVLVAALAARELGIAPDCYTVSFPDGADESSGAAAVARHLGLPHEIIDSREQTDWRSAPVTLLQLYGTPTDNLTALAVRQMCAAVKGRVKVAISGAGGDEIFHGYNKYHFLDRWRLLYRMPGRLFGWGRALGSHLPLPERLETALSLLAGSSTERYLRLKNGPAMEILNEALGRPGWRFDTLPQGLPMALAVREHDQRSALPASYLAAIDRGSMRESIEVRSPFLSRELAEHTASLDPRAFLRFGHKSVLRRLIARYLPEGLLSRHKQGFVFPCRRYLETRGEQAPVVPGLQKEAVATIWRRRREPFFDALSLRLAMLEVLLGERPAAGGGEATPGPPAPSPGAGG